MTPSTTTTASVTGRPGPAARPVAVLLIILVSYFMILLDNSVVFTGLPSIRESLGLSAASLSWVQDAYTLVFGGLLLLASRAGDLLGRRRLFVVGLVVFGTASGLIGLAPVYLGATIGFFYFTTQLMQDGLGFTPLQAGLGFLPMSLVNFVVALSIPRLSSRVRAPLLLAAGVAVTLAGMTWLSRAGIGDDYRASVALPMVLVGAGQGLAFAPLTSLGIAGVEPGDAGAASGLLNSAHQFGMALGLGVLVTVSAGAGSATGAPDAVAEHVRAALTGGSVLLAAALLAVLVVLVPTRWILRRPPTPTTVECTS